MALSPQWLDELRSRIVERAIVDVLEETGSLERRGLQLDARH